MPRLWSRDPTAIPRSAIERYSVLFWSPSFRSSAAGPTRSALAGVARTRSTATRYGRHVRALLGAASTSAERHLHVTVGFVAVVAWLAVVAGVDGDGAGIAAFVAAWTVMMVAMMLPSAAPFFLLYRRGSTAPATTALAAGYLAVWALVGVAAWVLHQAAMDIPTAAVLGAAGVYQLTPAKHACLRRCRTPADFLVERWRVNAFVLGADHGRWCLGCCWALMAVLVVAGMMGVAWAVAIAAIVAVEKMTSRGAALARVTGVALIAMAVWEGVG